MHKINKPKKFKKDKFDKKNKYNKDEENDKNDKPDKDQKTNRKDRRNKKSGKSGKLKSYIDEKGRKRYDLSEVNLNDQKKDTNLNLNEEKKTLIFPHADERTFLKPRDEKDIIDVEKIKRISLPLIKFDNTINDKNKKLLETKANLMGIITEKNTEENKSDVFYCKTCECALKDNAAYIEHLNGKKRNLFIFNT